MSKDLFCSLRWQTQPKIAFYWTEKKKLMQRSYIGVPSTTTRKSWTRSETLSVAKYLMRPSFAINQLTTTIVRLRSKKT